jgi:hypothetical protein
VKTRGLLAAAFTLAAIAVPAAGQQRPLEADRRRDQIQIMEGVLAKAVRLGAEQLGRRLQAVDPSVVWLTGQTRARGFVLDGYGVFFDVEVPTLHQSLLMLAGAQQRENQLGTYLEMLRRVVDSMPEGPSRQDAQNALRRVAQQVGPVQPTHATTTTSAAPTTVAAPGTVAAQNTTEGTPDLSDDPNKQYAEAMRNALIDAMLDHSISMNLGADEWLTVAARDSEGPLTPNEIYDSKTILLRVKGSDLAAYAKDLTKRAEVRQKVEVRVFCSTIPPCGGTPSTHGRVCSRRDQSRWRSASRRWR